MRKIKRFLECYVPISACNFRCSYCYVTQNKWWDRKTPDMSNVSGNIEKYLTQEKFGGPCMVNLCATGETLLGVYSVGIIKSFLKNGHYVMVVTNGTLTDKMEECCDFPK